MHFLRSEHNLLDISGGTVPPGLALAVNSETHALGLVCSDGPVVLLTCVFMLSNPGDELYRAGSRFVHRSRSSFQSSVRSTLGRPGRSGTPSI